MVEGGRDESSKLRYHARFQAWMAGTFLAAAALVAVVIFAGPQPEGQVTRLFLLAVVEIPLFIILALIGLNALVRRAKGPAAGRRRR